LNAARKDPISETQLERLVKLALGMKTLPEAKTGEAVMSCITIAEAGGTDTTQAPGAASEFTHGHRPKQKLDPGHEAEDCPSRYAGAEEMLPTLGDDLNTPPKRQDTTAQVSPAIPAAPPESTAAPSGTTAKPKIKRAKAKAARILPARLQRPSQKRHCRVPKEAARYHQQQSCPGGRRRYGWCLDAFGSMLRTTAQHIGKCHQRKG
jgi:hypothetical protein